MANLNIIKSWFKTGLKPTQQQFWDTWDSFWHKDQMIPMDKIERLSERFDDKADREALESHMADLTAHGLGAVRDFKTTIEVSEDFVIEWQTATPPGDTRTYAAKHGNHIGSIEGIYLGDDGMMMPYKPQYSYSLTDTGLIQTVVINGIFTGTITII